LTSADIDVLVERLDADANAAARDSLSEQERPEYDRLVQRGVTPHAALAVLRGRATDRAIRDAEPVADAVVRSILRMPPRANLPEADAIVKATR
jgi:hypothetical protein